MQIYEVFFVLSLRIQLLSVFHTSVSLLSALSFSAQQEYCALLRFLLFVPQFRKYFRQKAEHCRAHLICCPSFSSYSPCVSVFQGPKALVSYIQSSALVVYGRGVDLVLITSYTFFLNEAFFFFWLLDGNKQIVHWFWERCCCCCSFGFCSSNRLSKNKRCLFCF